MNKLLTLSLFIPALYSCGPLDSELIVPDAPVTINEDAVPTFEKPPEIKPVETPPTPAPPSEIAPPKNTLGLRIPTLIDRLPDESEIYTQPSFQQSTIDDEVEEATTIRATE